MRRVVTTIGIKCALNNAPTKMNYKATIFLTLILTAFVCSQATYAVVAEIPDPNFMDVIGIVLFILIVVFVSCYHKKLGKLWFRTLQCPLCSNNMKRKSITPWGINQRFENFCNRCGYKEETGL